MKEKYARLKMNVNRKREKKKKAHEIMSAKWETKKCNRKCFIFENTKGEMIVLSFCSSLIKQEIVWRQMSSIEKGSDVNLLELSMRCKKYYFESWKLYA